MLKKRLSWLIKVKMTNSENYFLGIRVSVKTVCSNWCWCINTHRSLGAWTTGVYNKYNTADPIDSSTGAYKHRNSEFVETPGPNCWLPCQSHSAPTGVGEAPISRGSYESLRLYMEMCPRCLQGSDSHREWSRPRAGLEFFPSFLRHTSEADFFPKRPGRDYSTDGQST